MTDTSFTTTPAAPDATGTAATPVAAPAPAAVGAVVGDEYGRRGIHFGHDADGNALVAWLEPSPVVVALTVLKA